MKKTKKLIIFGISDFAELVYEYFTHDSDYKVIAFTVDRAYISFTEKCGLPVIPFEELEQRFPTDQHEIFAAINFGKLNRIRQDVCDSIKTKGYKLASYISSKAFIWHNVVVAGYCNIGTHCFLGANSAFATSTHVGDFCWIGHGAVLSKHIPAHSFIKAAKSEIVELNEVSLSSHLAKLSQFQHPHA
jgi:hypothetical protein